MNYEQAKRYLADLKQDRYGRHQLAPADTKSWLVSHEGRRGGNYWYTVTWSYPGILTIGGDIGEITLTHYSAMNSWANAAAWVNGAGYDYLLGKSNLRKEYDPKDTFQFILDSLLEDIRASTRYRYEDLRSWRAEMREANAPRELEPWEDEEVGPFLVDPPEKLVCRFEPKYDWERDHLDQEVENRIHYPGRDTRKVVVPDGWEMWLRLYNSVGDSWLNPNEVFTDAGRRNLLRNLRESLGSDEDGARICEKLGFDDYYGSYNWSHSAINMVAALHRWAALVVETEEWSIARAKAAALAEHRKHVAMFDRHMPHYGYDESYAYAPGVIPFVREVTPAVAVMEADRVAA